MTARDLLFFLAGTFLVHINLAVEEKSAAAIPALFFFIVSIALGIYA